jgi:hypothetical protein
MEYLWFPCLVASVLAFIGFRQWLRHQQRAMVHRERLAALDKGAELPAWPAETATTFMSMETVLLLLGLIWLALGLGGMIAAFAIVPQLTIPDAPPPTIALIGLPAALVGVAHLIVYRVQRNKNK